MQHSEQEWKKLLTPEQFRVLRQKGTEAPFSGSLLDVDEDGKYSCAGCGSVLFASDSKYHSDISSLAGWPSFADAASSEAIMLQQDTSAGMVRTEVLCKTCGGHLGHAFDDKSSPTSQHYCINSAALTFRPSSSS